MQNQRTLSVNWIQEHSDHDRLNAVLQCFSYRGIATLDQIEILSGLTNHPARDVVKELVLPPGGLPALLSTANVILPGQRGRSLAAYILTTTGAQVLGQQARKAPMLSENIEILHALMEMKLFIAAKATHLPAEIEKVIMFDYPKNIRVDVLINGRILFEVEQFAGTKDLARITDKIIRLSNFFSSEFGKSFDHKVRILFALASDDNSTILRWQEVMAEVEISKGKLPFEIYYLGVNNFLANADWEEVSSFRKLEPISRKTNPSQNSPEVRRQKLRIPNFGLVDNVDVCELSIVMDLISSSMEKENEKKNRNCHSFFEMMQTIYDASHYEDGPVAREAAFPIFSLQLLYRFLHLHQNQELLLRLQEGFKKVKSAQYKGIVFFRNTLTHFYWDVFLRYFSFGRNGPLHVFVLVPGLDDDFSELRTQVKIKNWQILRGKSLQETPDYFNDDIHIERATAWVLDALYLYAQDLGLVVDNRMKGNKE